LPLFVRKVALSKWPGKGISLSDYPADAISDLKTSQNTLSFWFIDSLDDLKNVVIALATAPLVTRLEAMHLLWIEESIFYQKSFSVRKDKKGSTAVTKYEDTHRDICDLTYTTIGTMAEIVADAVHSRAYRTIPTPIVKEYVKTAYLEGDIELSRCHQKLVDILRKFDGISQ